MRAPPLTTNWGLVGTAFDYLARFQTQRNHPKAQDREGWVSESAIARVAAAKLRIGATYLDVLPGGRWHDHVQGADPSPWRDFVLHGSVRLHEAKQLLAAYLKGKAQLTDVASACIDLAYLDNVFRAGERGLPRQVPWMPHPDDVKDLLALHAALPEKFPGPYAAIDLNPTFGEWSRNVGGADADIIADDVLIDIKTTKNLELTDKFWHQLLGYAILDDLRARDEGEGPRINKVAIYFSRHGGFWAKDLASIRVGEAWKAALDHFEAGLTV